MSARVKPRPGEWLVVVDPQVIFADASASPWGSPMFAGALPRIIELVDLFAGQVVVTRYVADPGLGGSWAGYFDEWPFAVVPDSDPLYAVVSPLAERVADRSVPVVTEPTFGKWGPGLRSVVGSQPLLTLVGVATDCCVIATALAAADAGASVRVVADACAGSSADNHSTALDLMRLFAPQLTVV